MSPVELLREAAKVMRERASVATEGPWYPDWDSGVYAMPDMDPEWVISGGNVTYNDTQHIASWHPAVALAVADWLDYAAGVLEHLEQRGYKPTDNGYTSRALALARVYLGGES